MRTRLIGPMRRLVICSPTRPRRLASEVWAAIDYSQQEYRLMVHYASATNMVGADVAVAMYIDDIYGYLKARADGAVGRGRPVRQ